MGKREDIIKSAVPIYFKRGFDGISLNNLIKELGITKSAFYYYFNDKDDLIRTIREDFLYSYDWRTLNEVFRTNKSTKEKVREMMLATLKLEKFLKEEVHQDIDRNDFFRLLIFEGRGADGQHEIMKYYKNRLQHLIDALEQDKVKGLIRKEINAEEFAHHIMACADGLNFIWSVDGDIDYEHLVDINIKYLWLSVE
jgi:TetR/AcrR family transcriptional regulator, transcriptional repressor for nem operon